MRRRIASRRLIWPWMLLSHFGVFASSKSAMNTFAPEFSALMIILRSTGPVISTRRSWMSAGTGAQVQSPSRTARVSGRKSGSLPASNSAWRCCRRASSSVRRAPKARCSVAANASASGVRISAYSAVMRPVTVMPGPKVGCVHGPSLSGVGEAPVQGVAEKYEKCARKRSILLHRRRVPPCPARAAPVPSPHGEAPSRRPPGDPSARLARRGRRRRSGQDRPAAGGRLRALDQRGGARAGHELQPRMAAVDAMNADFGGVVETSTGRPRGRRRALTATGRSADRARTTRWSGGSTLPPSARSPRWPRCSRARRR